jgi:tight adherence protein C
MISTATFDIQTQLTVLEIGSILMLFWLALFIFGFKDRAMFYDLDEKNFSMHEIYFVGYAFLRLIRYSYDSNSDINMRKKLEVLYERKYIEYYLRVYRSRQATFGLTLLIVAFIVFGFFPDFLIFGAIIACAGVSVYYYGNTVSTLVQERKDSIMSDFCDVVSQMALLISSGMVLKDAWASVSENGESTIYKEMQMTILNINNGMPQSQAITEFGNRSLLLEVKKFSSNLTQGISRGSAELSEMLTNLSREAWNAKRQMVIRQKEATATKLLLPMIIMFIGVLIMIIVPLFGGMSSGLMG